MHPFRAHAARAVLATVSIGAALFAGAPAAQAMPPSSWERVEGESEISMDDAWADAWNNAYQQGLRACSEYRSYVVQDPVRYYTILLCDPGDY